MNKTLNTKEQNNHSIEDAIQSIKPFLHKLLNRKKFLLFFNLIIAIFVVIYLLFFAKPVYEGNILILPDYGNKSSMLSSLSGLASMAGIRVGEVSPNEIYKNIITSEKVIKNIIYRKFLTDEYPDSVNLIEYFEIDKPDDNVSEQMIEREMFLNLYKTFVDNYLSMDVDRVTTVLSITVKMPEPKLASDIANLLADGLNTYITSDRQSYAREQSQYLLNRLNDVKDSLNYYEEELKLFSEKNRAIIKSPQLTLERARLARKVKIAQSVYIELTKQYELVKLEEVKDTPVINILEMAKPLLEKVAPKRKNILLIAMFFSILISGGYVLFEDYIKKYYKIISE